MDGTEFEYVATADREAQIVSGFPKLKLGQDPQEVRSALGPPDVAQPMSRKESNALVGWTYTYYIKKRIDGPNEKDMVVEVFFDPAGKLQRAVPSNIPGLGEVGHPGGA
jgi:hypothetical protein